MADYAFLDLCFTEQCNLACTYCRTANADMARPLGISAVQHVIDEFMTHSTAAVFKISGYGEASLWPDYIDLLERNAPRFPSVQLITNGTLPLGHLKRLCLIPNLSFCTTVDSHKLNGNMCRAHNRTGLHDRFLAFVETVALEYGRRLEINCVVTKYNISQIVDFNLWLTSRYGQSVKLLPFPVRRFEKLTGEDLFPSSEQVTAFALGLKRLLNNGKDTVLPPSIYMDRLLEFLQSGRRSHPCYIDDVNYGIGPNLSILRCACDGHTRPSENIGNTRSSSRSVRSPGFTSPKCIFCFTHYEVLNLFIESGLSAKELGAFPSFSFPGVEDQLLRLKDRLIQFERAQ